MHQSDSAGPVVRVLPVGEPGRRGGDRPDHPELHDGPRRLTGAGTAAAGRVQAVQQKGGAPCPDRHGHEGGMQRVTEPDAVQQVLQPPGMAAGEEEGQRDRVLDLVAGRVDELPSLDGPDRPLEPAPHAHRSSLGRSILGTCPASPPRNGGAHDECGRLRTRSTTPSCPTVTAAPQRTADARCPAPTDALT